MQTERVSEGVRMHSLANRQILLPLKQHVNVYTDRIVRIRDAFLDKSCHDIHVTQAIIGRVIYRAELSHRRTSQSGM